MISQAPARLLALLLSAGALATTGCGNLGGADSHAGTDRTAPISVPQFRSETPVLVDDVPLMDFSSSTESDPDTELQARLADFDVLELYDRVLAAHPEMAKQEVRAQPGFVGQEVFVRVSEPVSENAAVAACAELVQYAISIDFPASAIMVEQSTVGPEPSETLAQADLYGTCTAG